MIDKGMIDLSGQSTPGAVIRLDTMLPVQFLVHGEVCTGTMCELNAKTAWVRYRGNVIKRHREKHQVRYQ